MRTTDELDEVLDVLGEMMAFNSADPRGNGKQVTVQYEFVTPSGVSPYYCRASGADWELAQGSLPDGDADVILRATPQALLAIIKGEVGGREAVMSGALDLRKAPSMPKLIAMRGMFNRYAKAQARRT